MPRHELLGEDLATLKPCRSTARSDNRQSSRFEKIHNPTGKWGFRPHKGQIDLFRFSESREFRILINLDIYKLCDLSNARVTGCTKQFNVLRSFTERPENGMFPAP